MNLTLSEPRLYTGGPEIVAPLHGHKRSPRLEHVFTIPKNKRRYGPEQRWVRLEAARTWPACSASVPVAFVYPPYVVKEGRCPRNARDVNMHPSPANPRINPLNGFSPVYPAAADKYGAFESRNTQPYAGNTSLACSPTVWLRVRRWRQNASMAVARGATPHGNLSHSALH